MLDFLKHAVVTPLFKESLSASSWQEAVKCCGPWEKNPGPQALSWNNQKQRAGRSRVEPRPNPGRSRKRFFEQRRYVAHFQQAAAQMHVKVAQDVETCALLRVLERRSARSDVRVAQNVFEAWVLLCVCLLYTSPSPRD